MVIIFMINIQNILIAGFDGNNTEFISSVLKPYNTIFSHTGKETAFNAVYGPADVVLMNNIFPDMPGIKVIEKIREHSDIPLIVISNNTVEQDIVSALDLGADDYITVPFGAEELKARIRTAVRHNNKKINTKNKYVSGELSIDFEKHIAFLFGKHVRLTSIEYKILELLCRYPGKVLSNEYLMNSIWGHYYCGDNKILRVNITNIRKKIESDPSTPKFIITEQGVGYKIIPET